MKREQELRLGLYFFRTGISKFLEHMPQVPAIHRYVHSHSLSMSVYEAA